MRKWLSVALLAGCTINQPPAQQYSGGGYQQPPTQGNPQPPPPEPEPPVYQPPSNDTAYSESVAPIYVDVNVSVEGQSVPSIDVFYSELAAYGTWYDDKTFGWVFAPADNAYQPYTNGHWKQSEFGWTWVSSDPFGWATDHYGRWV